MNGIAINVPQAQFMPKAIHESISFNSCNREVAIHYENVPQAQFMPKAIHESVGFQFMQPQVAIHSGVARSDNPAY